MRTVFTFVAVIALSVTGIAAEKTWSGKISDSNCGASHKPAAEHGKKKTPDRDCVLACVKGGGKYVFVSRGKVYTLENQDFAGLQEHAGHTVRLTGEMTGDSIKVSKVVKPAPRKAKAKA